MYCVIIISCQVPKSTNASLHYYYFVIIELCKIIIIEHYHNNLFISDIYICIHIFIYNYKL